MLKSIREAEEQGLSGEAAMLAAFEKNKGERAELKEDNEKERGMKKWRSRQVSLNIKERCP